MTDLAQAKSEQIEAALAPTCQYGHELAKGDDLCLECFNQTISQAPLHFLGIGLVTSLFTVLTGFVLSGLGSPNLGPVSQPIAFMALGVGMALLGIGNAVLFKLTIPYIQPLPTRADKDAYQRSLSCTKCGTSMRGGECPICTRRNRLRSDAIGFSWFPPVFVGSLVFSGAVSLGSIISGLLVFLGILVPYIAYAQWMSRSLPKTTDNPFLP